MMHLPPEIYDDILYHVSCSENEMAVWNQIILQRPSPRTQRRRDLANLRLVNRSFYHRATPLLFQHIVVISSPYVNLAPWGGSVGSPGADRQCMCNTLSSDIIRKRPMRPTNYIHMFLPGFFRPALADFPT
ncbi:hypothetical protein BJY04DRAFT_168428 [Aspergillus karnatakaensis]|uniref:uncharacterized protein n=1 Tax=Aspergillus karnatakaensis TaxID=1810916 RepID=UPI003CCD7231